MSMSFPDENVKKAYNWGKKFCPRNLIVKLSYIEAGAQSPLRAIKLRSLPWKGGGRESAGQGRLWKSIQYS